VLIKADIEHMRESTHIFMTSDKKNITVPYWEDQTFCGGWKYIHANIRTYKGQVFTSNTERRKTKGGERDKPLWLWFSLNIFLEFPTLVWFLNHFRCPHQCLDVYLSLFVR
jgi:hypothetical protein